MSYFAKASLTGVEKVAVAIAATRQRSALEARQRSALEGVQRRDAFAGGAAVRVDETAVSACKGAMGEARPRLPAQQFAAAAGPVARSGPQQRSQRRETQASGPSAIISVKRRLASVH